MPSSSVAAARTYAVTLVPGNGPSPPRGLSAPVPTTTSPAVSSVPSLMRPAAEAIPPASVSAITAANVRRITRARCSSLGESTTDVLEVGRQHGLERDHLARRRMDEGEPLGVQERPPDGDRRPLAAVARVTDDRMPDRRQVD